jgi:magnesium transporter
VIFVVSSVGDQQDATLAHQQLAADETIPPNAIWLDLSQPTIAEDRKVEDYVGTRVPTRSDLDFTEPLEIFYAENGVRYMHASVLSEPEDTPDITGVTFVMTPGVLVTVHYEPAQSFELFRQRICKSPPRALAPDALTIGLINTVLNASARALSEAGNRLDQIASSVFRAKGNQAQRSQIYSNTLDALGRVDEKVSNLRESMVTIERLLLFLLAEDEPHNMTRVVREMTKAALRDLRSLEADASFKAQKIQFLLDATLGLINLAQTDIIKLFSVLAVIFLPPTVIASIYGMNFKYMPELEWHFGYPLAIVLMIFAAIGPYLFFRSKKWLRGRGSSPETSEQGRTGQRREDGPGYSQSHAAASFGGREDPHCAGRPSRRRQHYSHKRAYIQHRVRGRKKAPHKGKEKQSESCELRVWRIDLLYFSSANLKFRHAGSVHGAHGFDFIVTDIGMSLEQLPGLFERRQTGHEITGRCYKWVH